MNGLCAVIRFVFFLVVYHLAKEKSIVISKVCTRGDTTKEFTWLIFISLHYAFYILCGRKYIHLTKNK